MGRFLLKGSNATVAIVLTVVAVLIPCGVWYVLGSRQLDRVTAELEVSARREAQTMAQQVAAKLALQLEDLRKVETERSHLHYFPRFLTRGKHCDRLKLQTSPLATGDYPQAVKLYFQLDVNGNLTAPRPDARLATLDIPVGSRFDVGTHAPASGQLPTSIAPWASMSQVDAGLPASDDQTELGSFAWHTGRLEGMPALMAVRAVVLAGHRYFQGFVVQSGQLAPWMFDGGYEALLKYGPAAAQPSAELPLQGVGWHVSVNPHLAMAAVRKQEATLRSQFNYSYLGGLIGALLTGSCVVALVVSSGNLARERSRFAAAAAHELRTPLAGIRLHGEMLAAGLGNPAAVAKYAQRITDEAERLGRVVVNVLNHSQADRRPLALDLRQDDLRSTLEDALSLLRPLVEEGGAQLLADLPQSLQGAIFDRDAVLQILNNLIDNAEKYSRGAADRRIHVSAYAIGSAIELKVADHGPGVADGFRSKLFRPFTSADTSTKTAGLGLGLSVVAALTHAHRGQVRHEETPGGGATFVVTLPQAA